MRTTTALIAGWLVAAVHGVGTQTGPATSAPPERVDYMAFAQGAVPIKVGGTGASLGATFEHAIRIVDGASTVFTVVQRAGATTETEFTYELPALTTFDRFAVPNVTETPSPTQTFTKTVEVHGSTTGPDTGFAVLASATLETHRARGEWTELKIAAKTPARWVKVRLAGGIQLPSGPASLEFSEIVGNGAQESPAPVDRFKGRWQGTGVKLELCQDGPVVNGCYDIGGVLSGTVTGNILRATGVDSGDQTKSAFISSVAAGWHAAGRAFDTNPARTCDPAGSAR